jgi:hypothetical protein
MYYMLNRWYEPTLGRFITKDPILESIIPQTLAIQPPTLVASFPAFMLRFMLNTSQSLHSYVYAKNNPVNMQDSSGLGPPEECVYYEKLCKGEECGKIDYYACLAYIVCSIPGDNEWANCVRNCLIDAYKAGRRSAWEIIEDHARCLWECTFGG